MGGVRTALYNYLFAKHNGGKFLLRIEDTDQNRFVPGAEEYIVASLKWCGLVPDEGPGFGGDYGPYRQSDRKAAGLYSSYADKLLESGNAYYAFDTAEDLDEMRERLKSTGVAAPQYNSFTRQSMKNSISLSADEVKSRLESRQPFVIRIKMPRNEEIRFFDQIRGWVTVNSANLDDKVLFKSDGMPTYHLANVVDDHLMKISHVIRGEEWLPSAPLHVMLYRFMGWEESMPQFAHLPLLLRPDGNGKLSKRDGDKLGFPVFPLQWQDKESGEISSGYREKGYYPEAFINLLALLGWNPGTAQEIFSMEELIASFSLERVGKAGSKFDPEKARWFNQQYLRKRSGRDLAKEILPALEKKGFSKSEIDLENYCEIMKERAVFPDDLLDGEYFFNAPSSYDNQLIEKKWDSNSPGILKELANTFEAIDGFDATSMESAFKTFISSRNIAMGAAMPLLRIVITGRGTGPSVFQVSAMIGKEEMLRRIRTGIEKIGVKWA